MTPESAPGPRSQLSRPLRIALVAVPLAAAAIVHGQILGGFFVWDDFLHLYNVANESLARFASRPHGGHVLVSFRIAFYLMWQLFGLEARAWFAVVLLTHLFNTWLLGAILRRLTGEPLVAAAAALLWGISPISRGALSWISVYSHVLVVPFVGLVIYDLARIRAGEYHVSRFTFLKWNALLLAASNSFGIGTTMAVTSPLWATALMWDHPARRRVACALLPALLLVPLAFFGVKEIDRRLSGLPVLTVIPFGLPGVLAILDSEWRLFAYGLVSSLGGGLIAVVPSFPYVVPGVAAGPLAGLAPDAVAALTHWMALALLLALAALAWRGGAACRALIVGGLLLALCGYGGVALGRTKIAVLLGQSVTWITLQARYQYSPAFALWIALAVAASTAGLSRLRRRTLAVSLIAWVGLQLAFAIPSARQMNPPGLSEMRKRFDDTVELMASRIRLTPRGNVATVVAWDMNLIPFATRKTFPGWAALFVIAFPDEVVEGRTVRFIIADDETLRVLRADPNTRIAHLVIGAHERPPPPARHGGDAAEPRPSLPPGEGSH